MNPIDALRAAGFKPIIVNENTDFSKLGPALLQPQPTHSQICADRIAPHVIGYSDMEDDVGSDVASALCDLMHLCACADINFDEKFVWAKSVFNDERETRV